MKKERKKFNLRSFTSFSLVISTIIMSWSGFILYVAPPGRIANWGTWKLMLFTKTEWQALHTIFSYLFFILFIIHLFFVNWKTFLTYFKSKIQAGLNRKWELVTSVLLSAVIFVGILRTWIPFGPVMSFGEKMQGSWEGKFTPPPVLHMETYTLEQLALEFDSVAPAELVKTLTGNNIKIKNATQTLELIAEDNHTTPSEIYEILAAKFKKQSGQAKGGAQQGYGKLTVVSVATNTGKDASELLEILKLKGIEANPETTLREIADQINLTPRDIYTLLSE